MKLAQAYGLSGRRAANVEEFESALRAALEGGEAALIECPISIDEMVRPMVNGGSHITEFMVD